MNSKQDNEQIALTNEIVRQMRDIKGTLKFELHDDVKKMSGLEAIIDYTSFNECDKLHTLADICKNNQTVAYYAAKEFQNDGFEGTYKSESTHSNEDTLSQMAELLKRYIADDLEFAPVELEKDGTISTWAMSKDRTLELCTTLGQPSKEDIEAFEKEIKNKQKDNSKSKVVKMHISSLNDRESFRKINE